LTRAAREVTVFDEALTGLVDDMIASMHAAEGVGLAANQIGCDLDVFVYDCPVDDDDEVIANAPPAHGRGALVNPRLVRTWGESLVWGEGCLSLPGLVWDTTRADCALVRGLDVHGSPIEVAGSGLLGRCLQHETDHLRGRLFVDTLGRWQRHRAVRAYRRL
jgi:peptide deformylase